MAVCPNDALIASPPRRLAAPPPFSIVPPKKTDLLYHFLVKQVGVVATQQIQRVMTRPAPSQDEEKELDMLQLERWLRWLTLVFDGTEEASQALPSRQAYKQELYHLYRSICSDWRQYERWKAHNRSLWFLAAYRQYDTKALARKLLSDVRLFREGMMLFGAMDREETAGSAGSAGSGT